MKNKQAGLLNKTRQNSAHQHTEAAILDLDELLK